MHPASQKAVRPWSLRPVGIFLFFVGMISSIVLGWLAVGLVGGLIWKYPIHAFYVASILVGVGTLYLLWRLRKHTD